MTEDDYCRCPGCGVCDASDKVIALEEELVKRTQERDEWKIIAELTTKGHDRMVLAREHDAVEHEELMKDAARYRLARFGAFASDNRPCISVGVYKEGKFQETRILTGDEADIAIDAYLTRQSKLNK